MPVVDPDALAAVVRDLGEECESMTIEQLECKVGDLETDRTLLEAELQTARLVLNRRWILAKARPIAV